ncbi:hypothetical protein BKA80DRAFT_276998 [Phyllosticta citrichinensis]
MAATIGGANIAMCRRRAGRCRRCRRDVQLRRRRRRVRERGIDVEELGNVGCGPRRGLFGVCSGRRGAFAGDGGGGRGGVLLSDGTRSCSLNGGWWYVVCEICRRWSEAGVMVVVGSRSLVLLVDSSLEGTTVVLLLERPRTEGYAPAVAGVRVIADIAVVDAEQRGGGQAQRALPERRVSFA